MFNAPAYGDTQWGNDICYHSSTIMCLSRNGVTDVFMNSAKDNTRRIRNLIGVPIGMSIKVSTAMFEWVSTATLKIACMS